MGKDASKGTKEKRYETVCCCVFDITFSPRGCRKCGQPGLLWRLPRHDTRLRCLRPSSTWVRLWTTIRPGAAGIRVRPAVPANKVRLGRDMLSNSKAMHNSTVSNSSSSPAMDNSTVSNSSPVMHNSTVSNSNSSPVTADIPVMKLTVTDNKAHIRVTGSPPHLVPQAAAVRQQAIRLKPGLSLHRVKLLEPSRIPPRLPLPRPHARAAEDHQIPPPLIPKPPRKAPSIGTGQEWRTTILQATKTCAHRNPSRAGLSRPHPHRELPPEGPQQPRLQQWKRPAELRRRGPMWCVRQILPPLPLPGSRA